ncbi:polyketide synthase, partial [Mycobacterium sp. PS03-16]|uniref:acyl carrier protein n=1 Tax=Mycobacterium sp. PS03-16 TaxID=2559611 RepID=UPI00110122D2
TLARDTDDTLTFHTNLNTTHTTHPPQTPHPPEPHPQLPTTPWRHTHHWIEVRSGHHPDPVRVDRADVPMPSVGEMTDGSWLLIVDEPVDTVTRGARADVVPTSVLDESATSAALLDALAAVDHVVFAPELPADGFDANAGYRLFSGVRRLTSVLAAMATPPTLHLAIGVGDAKSPTARATLIGLADSLSRDHAELWGGLITVGASTDENTVVQEATPDGDIIELWRTYPPDRRRSLLRHHISVLIAAVMGLASPDALDPEADFFELGMDSMMTVVLQRALLATLGVEVSSPDLFDNATVESLADHLVPLGESDAETAPPPDRDGCEPLAGVSLAEKVG